VISRSGFVIAVAAALLSGISLGLIGGILSVRYVMGTWMPAPREHHGWMRGGPPEGPPGAPPPGVIRLEHALDLSPAQRESIEAIVMRTRTRFAAMRDSLHRQIDAQLTPAQREKWHSLDHRWLPPRGPWPPPGDGDHPPPGQPDNP
jgi:hypothetical protein